MMRVALVKIWLVKHIVNNIGENVSNCDCFYLAINKIKHELDSIIDEETQKSLEIK